SEYITPTDSCPDATMTATDTLLQQNVLTRHLVRTGFLQMVPIAAFVMVFGSAFGLAATQSGLDAALVVFMSTLVLAGAAQFAVLDMWGPQMPILALVLTVFAINARHLLMGATLYPW